MVVEGGGQSCGCNAGHESSFLYCETRRHAASFAMGQGENICSQKGDRQIDNGSVQRAVVNVLTQFISGLGLVRWLALSLEVGERRT